MKIIKVSVFILILALYSSFLFYKIDFLTLSVNDLGRHITNGEMVFQAKDVLMTNFYSYTEPNFPFINHHWLSGVVFYFLYEIFGFGGMVIFKAIVLLLAFALIFFTSIKKADFWLVALFSLPAVLMLKERVELRPEIFSYLFIALFLYFLIDLEKHPARKRVFWLVPLQLLWVNLHTFFFIGILMTAGFLLEKIIYNLKNLKDSPLIKKLVLLLAILIAVSFINPNGVKGVLYPLNIFENYGFEVAENRSLLSVQEEYWWDVSIKIFTPMVWLLALSFLFTFRRQPIFYFLGSGGSAASSFLLVRVLPLFSLFFLPAVSANFNGIFLKIKNSLGERRPQVAVILSKGLTIAFLVALVYTAFINYQPALSTGSIGERGIGFVSNTSAAATFFKEQNLKGPIFNNYDIGSYLVYHLFPQERVFVDNRPEAYPSVFFNDVYYPMMQQEEKWQEVNEKYNFNVIFLGQQTQSDDEAVFLRRRLEDPSWAFVYADAYIVILLKNSPQNQDTINKFQITQENIGEKINYLQESDRLEERVAAVNLFIIGGREDLVLPVLQRIVDKWPEYSQGWLMLGEMASTKDDLPSLTSAISFVEKAIDLGEKTSEAYTLLGFNYFRAGQFKQAEKALKTALRINPDRQDAQDYLRQLQKYLVE